MRSMMAMPLALLLFWAAPAWCGGRCAGYKWDVSRELALFDGTGEAVAAGATAASLPTLRPDRLYRLHLVPQAQASFAVPPGRNTTAQDSYAGVARLELDAPGNYRVSVDAPLWIDVAAGASLAPVADFQGQHDCEGPHKIVVFELHGTASHFLQLSGSPKADIRLTVTKAPVRRS